MDKFLIWLCATFGLFCPPTPPPPTPVPPPAVQVYPTKLYHQGGFDRYDSTEKTYLATNYSWATFSPDKYLNDYEDFAKKTGAIVSLYVKTLGVKPSDSWYQEAKDKDLFWRDVNGNVIKNPSNGWETLDVIGKTDAVAQYWINHIEKKLKDEPYNAVFMDNSNIPDNYMPTSSMPGYSDVAYLSAIANIATQIKTKLPQLKILANGLTFKSGATPTNDGGSLLPVVDGLMSEHYSLKVSADLKSYGQDRLWSRIKRIRELSSAKKFLVLLDDTSSDPRSDFSYCMYLLSRDDSGNVLWSKGTPDQVLHFAHDDFDFGKPVSEPTLSGSVAQRAFQAGKVFVNIGDTSQVITKSHLEGSLISFSGNGTFKTAKPVIKETPITEDVVLAPLSCVVTRKK